MLFPLFLSSSSGSTGVLIKKGMQPTYLPKSLDCADGEGECDLRPHLWGRTDRATRPGPYRRDRILPLDRCDLAHAIFRALRQLPERAFRRESFCLAEK